MSRRERRLLRIKGKKYKPDSTIEESKEQAVQHAPAHKKKHSKLLEFYDTKYKSLMWITVVLLAISIIIIGVQIVRTGEFLPRGISLKGGVSITAPYSGEFNVDELQKTLQDDFPQGSVSVRVMSSAGKSIGFIVDASDIDAQDLLAKIKDILPGVEKTSVETVGSALGEAFFKQTLFAMLLAFVLMSFVVFISFKTFVPSAAVILSAVSDITMTIAVINVIGMKVETAGIAALLMLIGYSVDTDVLLTTRVLKRQEGTVFERIMGAMATGMTMTVTAIVAVIVAYFFTQSETLKQIMLILFIGLMFDIMNTWIQNVGILRLYVEHQSKKKAAATLADYGENVKDAEFEEVVDLEEETEEDRREQKKETVHKVEHVVHHEHHHEDHKHAEHEHTHTHQTHTQEDKKEEQK